MRRYSPDQTIHPDFALAREHSLPFSDLRANPDVRLMRLWIDVDGEGSSWRSIDIARGGLSVVNKLNAAEHASTDRNFNLLRQVSRSAFTLYQHDKLTDAAGNLMAIALPRNSSLQLGHVPHGHFDALRGNYVASNHIGLQVDDDDMLAIEGYTIDHLPQIEVIAADSEDAVQSGLTLRPYGPAKGINPEGVTLIQQKRTIEPLHSALSTIPPQFVAGSSPVPVQVEQPVSSSR